MTLELPEPECEGGYPLHQLETVMDDSQFSRLQRFLYGQTMMWCSGSAYNYDLGSYEQACGGVAHGTVIYTHDVERFLLGVGVGD
jgi:hypothetical protein